MSGLDESVSGLELSVVGTAVSVGGDDAEHATRRLRYHSRWRFAKRTVDLVVVVVALPLILVVGIFVAIGVKATSRGPILFRQERIGQFGRRFTICKFRTMYVDATERLSADTGLLHHYLHNDFKVPAEHDPRVVPFGRFLRASSLDELPQVLHVLRGTMSLVGPRPIVPGELLAYERWAYAYLAVLPGLTGRWQCGGRSHVKYPERAIIDAAYLEEWTLRGDAVILLKTIPAVLRHQGAH